MASSCVAYVSVCGFHLDVFGIKCEYSSSSLSSSSIGVQVLIYDVIFSRYRCISFNLLGNHMAWSFSNGFVHKNLGQLLISTPANRIMIGGIKLTSIFFEVQSVVYNES